MLSAENRVTSACWNASESSLEQNDELCEVLEAVTACSGDVEMEKKGDQAAAHQRAANAWDELDSMSTIYFKAPHLVLGVLCNSPSSEASNSTMPFGLGSRSASPEHASVLDDHHGVTILNWNVSSNHWDSAITPASACNSSSGLASSRAQSDFPRPSLRRAPPGAPRLRRLNKAEIYLEQQIALFEDLQRQRRHKRRHRSQSTGAPIEQTMHVERQKNERRSSLPLHLCISKQESMSAKPTSATKQTEPVPTAAFAFAQPEPRRQRDLSLHISSPPKPGVKIWCQQASSNQRELALKYTDAADLALMYTDAAHLVMEKTLRRPALRNSSASKQ